MSTLIGCLMPLSYTSSYGQAFLSRPALHTQRRIALGVSFLMLVLMSMTLPIATFHQDGVVFFLPLYLVALILCNGFTSLLLGLQAIHLRHATLALLAGAYCFLCSVGIFQLSVVLKHLNQPEQFLKELPSSWFWMGWIARTAFPLFIIASINQEDRIRTPKILISFWLAPFLLPFIFVFIFHHISNLTPLIILSPYIHWSDFLIEGLLPANLLMICLALLLLARKSRFRTRLHLWLGVSLIGAASEIILTMASKTPFSIGEYGALIFNLLTILILLGALLWDIHDMQGTLQRINAQLHKQANHDALTGLLLRRPFNDFLFNALENAYPNQPQPVLCMIDIDDFKAYNDAFGHLTGDSCLISIAHALQEKVKEHHGCIARMGGEELAVLFEGKFSPEPQKLAEILRKEIENLRLPHAQHARLNWVTVSIGWALGKRGESISQWLKNADDALYKAKSSGRNKAIGYSSL